MTQNRFSSAGVNFSELETSVKNMPASPKSKVSSFSGNGKYGIGIKSGSETYIVTFTSEQEIESAADYVMSLAEKGKVTSWDATEACFHLGNF